MEWLTRIGILEPRTPGTYTSGDVFRVKMIESLLQAGFTPEQVEAAVEAAGLDLRHVDRYILLEPGERSPRTFAQFAAEVGPHAERILTAAYQLLGVAPPAPESHLPVDEEDLLRAHGVPLQAGVRDQARPGGRGEVRHLPLPPPARRRAGSHRACSTARHT